MTDSLYSVEQVAERLGLHVRTIRNYVRDGQAARGPHRQAVPDRARGPRSVHRPPGERPRRHGRAAAAHRGVEHRGDRRDQPPHGRPPDHPPDELGRPSQPGGRPLRIETAYDAERSRMKVIVLGGLADTARLFDYMEGVLAS